MNGLIICILGVGLIFICSVCGLTETSSGNDIGARKLLAKGRHRNHGHQSLAKEDNVEMELLRLKDPTKQDEGFITLTDQKPEFTSENLEEELTDVRPLDIPLDLLEVETFDELDHVTRSMRTFGQVDIGLTTVSSVTQEMETAFRSDTDVGSWDQGVDIRTKSSRSDILKKDERHDDDDEDEDDDNDHDESDEDDSDGDNDDNENDSDDGEDDDENEEDDNDDDESVENIKDKIDQLNNEEHIFTQKKIKDEIKVDGVGNSSIEHGRQWKETDSTEKSQVVTKSPVTTNNSDISIDTLHQNLVTFVRNGNPEAKNQEGSVEEEANTSKNGESQEEKEIENNAANPLKLVDSVNPKADEDLLELMVRIAENSMEWLQVRRELQQLDQDLMSSRKSTKALNVADKFKHSMEKKDKQNKINGFDSQTNATKEYRKHIQGEKKKKKKKKQKQKGKLKNQAVKLKVKNKEEMRREELHKAGVLSLPDGNGTSKVSKENLKTKTHWNKTSKQSHTNVDTSYFIDSARNNSTNRKEQPLSDFITKQTQNKYLPGSFTQGGENDRVPSIDSTLAKLTDYRSPVKVSTNKLPTNSDTIKLHYNKHKVNSNELKVNDMQNKIDSSWRSDIQNQKNDKYKWYGTRLNKDMQDSQEYLNDWDKSLIHSDKNGLIGTARYSEGSDATYTWQNPKEERRYYNEESIYNTGWPRFSVESLKHRSDKGGLDIGSNNNLETGIPKIKTWNTNRSPDFSDNNTKQNIVKIWSKPVVATSKHTELLTNTWPQSEQKHISEIDTAIAQHTKEASSSRQWPHFTYHRVTSSPQILVQQQKEAQQRNRQRNAYIAVSVITPPGRNKGQDKHQSTSNLNKSNESPIKSSVTPLPDKMNQLLSMRSAIHKLPVRDLLEEQLVDMAIAGEQKTRPMPWSHARHLDKIQEQLKTLSAMGEKLQYHWLEKERLLQILRDGGMSGSGFYRTQKNEGRVTTPASHDVTPQTFP